MEPTRRQLVQMLAAAALSGGAVADAGAQRRGRLTVGDLQRAIAVQGRDLPADQIQHLRNALERALQQVDRIRAFDLDETVGLPLVFSPTAPRVE